MVHTHMHRRKRARICACALASMDVRCQVFYKAKLASQMQRRGSKVGRRSSVAVASMSAIEAEKAAQQENASISLQLAAAERESLRCTVLEFDPRKTGPHWT